MKNGLKLRLTWIGLRRLRFDLESKQKISPHGTQTEMCGVDSDWPWQIIPLIQKQIYSQAALINISHFA